MCMHTERGGVRFQICLPSGFTREYCNWETFKGQCPDGQVILMSSAFYGRMKHGRCIQKNFDEQGNPRPVGCKEDIIGYVKKIMSSFYNSSCIVLAFDNLLVP